MPLKTLAEYESAAAAAHGHICAGQILGLRMAMHGLDLLGILDPTGADRKRLLTVVEIDRCAADAIPVVTGCRLGKRALKFRDFGKSAATFCDLREDRAVRLAARESARALARDLHPEIGDRNRQQIAAYREMPAGDLFSVRWVRVRFPEQDLPGYKGHRALCEDCGEAISFRREVMTAGRVLCRSCAGERYWEPLD